MPRGVYKRSKNKVIKLLKPKLKASGFKPLPEPVQTAQVTDTVGYTPIVTEMDKLRREYQQALRENEMLRRVIGAQKETIDSLCRSMIEINSVEGRWR
jgi:hypothetical protein